MSSVHGIRTMHTLHTYPCSLLPKSFGRVYRSSQAYTVLQSFWCRKANMLVSLEGQLVRWNPTWKDMFTVNNKTQIAFIIKTKILKYWKNWPQTWVHSLALFVSSFLLSLIVHQVMSSVTGLVDFWKFVVANFLAKLTQMHICFKAILKNRAF